MITQEALFIETRDSWGNRFVATYERGAYDANMICRAVADNPASGHGWAGIKTCAQWEARRDKASAVASPYRIPEGEAWPEGASAGDCEGWMVWASARRPFLFATKAEAFEAARAFTLGVQPKAKPREYPPRGCIYA